MITAVVPVKALAAAKSRLAPVLAPGERAGLAESLLARVLRALAESGVAGAIAVVSPDERALAIADAHGVVALRETHAGLNAALEQSRRWAVERGSDSLLVVLGDLPLLTPGDIVGLAEVAGDPILGAPVVVLAPDRHGRGTNALLMRPPTAVPFYFGHDSYARHFAAAAASGAEIMIYRSPGTAFDLDTPADLAALALRQAPAGVAV